MAGEHDGSGLVEGNGGEDVGPLVGCHAICRIGDDGSGKALKGFVEEGEGNRRGIVGDYTPVPLVISYLGHTLLRS